MNYYDNHEHVSASLLKVAAKSLTKAEEYIRAPFKETEALILGRCFHEMMEDKRDFIVYDESQRPEQGKTFASKLNKEWKAGIMAQNEDVITLAQFQDLEKMAKNLKASKFYQGLVGTELEGIEKEFYHEFTTGNKAKCKPDALYNGADGSLICVDWKTTAEPLNGTNRSAFYAVKKFRYDLQAVHYSEILKEKTGKEVHFFFVFVEKTAPYDVLPVYLNPNGELYNDAFIEWNDLLTDLNKCFKTGVWPTLESSIENKYISL
jgi:hypothetical protein